jgi:hypothetical protein
VINQVQKDLALVCTKRAWPKLRDELKDRALKGFYYMLRLNSKTYKYLCANRKILD